MTCPAIRARVLRGGRANTCHLQCQWFTHVAARLQQPTGGVVVMTSGTKSRQHICLKSFYRDLGDITLHEGSNNWNKNTVNRVWN